MGMDQETRLNADLQLGTAELSQLDCNQKVKSTTQLASPPNWHNILQGVSQATKALLTNSDRTIAINQALAILGQATAANRVYICEYHPHFVTKELAFSRRFEWVESGITPQNDNPLLQNLSQNEFDLQQWHQQLTTGYSFSAIASSLSQPQRQFLESLQVKSVLLVPIPVESKIWGFIGFSDCRQERQWSQDEEAALITMAATLGSIMAYRQMTDVLYSERQQTQVQLALSEERFRLMVEGSEQAFFYIHDHAYVLEYVSPSVQAVLGYTPEELVGNDYHVIVHESSQALADQLTDQALLTGKRVDTYAIFGLHKDGRILVLEIAESPVIINGQVQGMQGFARDITDRHQALEQLKAMAKRDRLLRGMGERIRTSLDLQTILDTTVAEVREFLQADRVYIVNTNNRGGESAVVAESVAANYRSVREWTLTSKNHEEVLHSYFHPRVIYVVNDTTKKTDLPAVIAQDFISFQMRAIVGVPIMVDDQFYGLLVANQCEKPREWQDFEIDLLEELSTPVAIAIQQAKLYQELQSFNAELEQQVNRRTQELQQKYSELEELQNIKDEFLHAFSHDLRTPIMGILLVMKNLLSQSNGESVTISPIILERVIQSSERQLTLIESLLEAHSSDVKGLTIQQLPLSLHTFTQAIVKDLEPQLIKYQATITNEIAANLPLVSADALHLRRVFENLITNALNHNPPGLNIILNATVEKGMMCCTITDNGVGIDPDVCERLFNRYIRGRRSQSTGIGLGLYLCRQIISTHGGEIGVISEPNVGAKFWFTLPLANPFLEL
ncbi:multi-sensor signal transduction histidine kinase [Nostoc sp. NIES-4103]|nr:multi-sensor signal transduction histidine kinase [Nostoc sp. NIES-4103]